MSIYEPLPVATKAGSGKAATNRRWRPWYSTIADVMLRTPNATIAEIAAELGRGPATIGAIMASDTFKDYFARRRQEFSARHDFAITCGLQEVAVEGIRQLSQRLKSDRVERMSTKELRETTTSVLDRLGYGPAQAPQVAVNVNQQNNVVVPPTSLETLEQARSALRAAEALRLAAPSAPPAVACPAEVEESRGGEAEDSEVAQLEHLVLEGEILDPEVP